MGQHFQLAEVEGQVLRAQAGKALADGGHGIFQMLVHGIIAGDAHIVANALGDGLVDDVPLALGALVGVDVVLILDHHALASGLFEDG